MPQGKFTMTQQEQAAIEFIEQKLQEVENIHKQALNALNAVLGKEHLQKWKKQVIGVIAEKIGPDCAKQLSKDWLETSYFVGDLFDELSDEVEMCRRHLKKLTKEIRTKGLSGGTSAESNPA